MISWKEVKIQIRTTVILPSVTLDLRHGGALGIIGLNGSGKTILAKALAGMLPVLGSNQSETYQAVYVSFQSEFQLKHGARAYRQQRWNWTDPEFIPTVREEFDKLSKQEQLQKLVAQFGFEDKLKQFVISLSNGEQRKFELIKALTASPDLLVIDNAMNGLDSASRVLLNEMLNQMISEGHSLVLTGMKPTDFPQQLDRFIAIDAGKTCRELTRAQLPENEEVTTITTGEMPFWKKSEEIELIRLKNLQLEMA
ncbi:MAG: ATP-binding cassette domain-containing protein, partial [Prolixibacteraceae bacterium]|nr:ATP-binding cassette domain-containing protein [Prolixibacteraceae bacterium]